MQAVDAPDPSEPDDPPAHPPAPLPRRPSVEALARHAIAVSAHRLVTSTPIAREGEDPEGVHQARVATRRLRSDLGTFRAVLDPDDVDGLRRELRWIGEALGRVRDADVLLLELRDQVTMVRDGDRAAVEVLATTLRDEYDRHHTALIAALTSKRYADLLGRLIAAAERPSALVGPDDHPRRDARALARRRWLRLRRAVKGLPDSPTDEQLHEVRKRAKHVRYSLEAITPIAPRRARRLTKRIRDVQNVLGLHHDAIETATWLRTASMAVGDPAVTFAAGVVARGCLDDAEMWRGAWRHDWQRARRRARDVF